MSNNYTYEEQRKIVRYIIENKIVGNLQGNALWKQMEKEQVLDRSWQSMRSHFKTKIIDMLHLYNISDYERRMILHGFGRRTRANTRQSERSAPLKKPLPFSSDSDSDITVCVTVPRKRARRDSGSSSSIDLLTCGTNSDVRNANVRTAIGNNEPSTSTSTDKQNCDIRSFMVNTAIDNNQPSTSASSAKDNSKDQQQNDIIVISDNDDEPINEPIKREVSQPIVNSMENEPFSVEEDTQLIMFFKSHYMYLSDIENKFAYVAFQYDTPTSIRTAEQLKARFVEHVLPKLYTYDCLTYEEMITYYDRADVDIPLEFQQLIRESVAEQKKRKELAAKKLAIVPRSTDIPTSMDVPMHAQQQPSPNNMSNTEGPPEDVEFLNDDMLDIWGAEHDVQDQQALHDACNGPVENPASKLTMVDAATQTRQKHGVDKMCGTDAVDATSPVQLEPSLDRLSSIDVPMQSVGLVNDGILHRAPEHDHQTQAQHDACAVSEQHAATTRTMADSSTQTQQQQQQRVDKMCSTEVPVKHIEYVSDGMLHIFVPERDDHGQPQNRKTIYNTFNVAEKNVHFIRQTEYNMLSDKRDADTTVRASIRKFLSSKCDMVCMIAEVRRFQQTLRNVRGQGATVGKRGGKHSAGGCNLVLKNDSETCSNVSAMSSNIIPCTPDSVSDGETTASNCVTTPGNVSTRATQTANETELIFHVFQTGLGKTDVSTQIDHDPQQMDTAQDGGEDQHASLVGIQPSIEFCAGEFNQPMQVEQASGESDDKEVPKDSSAGQSEPLDLSAQSHDVDSIEIVLSSNSEPFYTAASQ